MTDRTSPPGFLWGVASAGHQNEGDNTNSDTWFVENVSPTVFKEPSGKACDGWHRWREDVGLAADLGLTAYRFSVEWARVEPEEGTFDEAAIDHYEAIVDEAIARGMAPVVTFNHFTSPHWFAKSGGWLDADAPRLFARYADRLMERFGDRIAYAITLNEPNLPHVCHGSGCPTSSATSIARAVRRERRRAPARGRRGQPDGHDGRAALPDGGRPLTRTPSPASRSW